MDKETKGLIQSAKSGDKGAMEKLVLENEKLIWSIVKRFSGRGAEILDLFQIGAVGLIKAIKNFDISKEVCFSTYAVPMIMGEIRKFLRDDGAVKISRSLKEASRKVMLTAEEIAKETGKTASISEVAKRLDMTLEEAAQAFAASEPTVSLYHEIGENLTVMDTICDKSDFEEKLVDNMSLYTAANKLSNREKNIIFMRYFQNKTQTQTAEMLGISQVQVSRLEKKVLEKLRREIG